MQAVFTPPRAVSRTGTRDARAPARLAVPRTLICLSHLRWNFVFQRPQHLMTRFARDTRVIYMEEPLHEEGLAEPRLSIHPDASGVDVLVPLLPAGMERADAEAAQRKLLDAFLKAQGIDDHALWYYTPMSLAFTEHLDASLIVYDAMDELSAFRGAPPELVARERRLLERADVVFTGGHSLYESKRRFHANAHAFPSSVDIAHFSAARRPLAEPQDQQVLARPRLGFYGVIDERFDIELIDAVARARPQWQIVLVGPVVKIDPALLPRHANIHYLGPKAYDDLPAYLASWDVALMPFAMNESTRFISPTKTPEYLAAGRPVVSTPIADVVRSYGHSEVVRIARTAGEFIEASEAALRDAGDRQRVARIADEMLKGMSWDSTWSRMKQLMRWEERVPEEQRVPDARVLDKRSQSARTDERLAAEGSTALAGVARRCAL